MILPDIRGYDARRYPFAAIVQALFGHPLNRLHERVEAEGIARLEVGKDQQTPFHKKFYTIDQDFWAMYKCFCRDVACYALGRDPGQMLYQRRPTFRVHLPGNVATGGWHRDGDYNHPLDEINFVLPLTPFLPPSPSGHAGNGFFIESGTMPLGYRDAPVFIHPEMDVGDLLIFPGARRLHGSVENRTGLTRVSLDFRLLPKDRLPENVQATVNQKIAFKVGPDGYYDTF